MTGLPIPVLHGVLTVRESGMACFALTQDGSLLYAPGGVWRDDLRVVWVDRMGRPERLVETPGNYAWPRLSPDGSALAVTISGANETIWLYDIARASNVTRVDAWWSPDGEHDIDMVGLVGKKSVGFVGSVKWSARKLSSTFSRI